MVWAEWNVLVETMENNMINQDLIEHLKKIDPLASVEIGFSKHNYDLCDCDHCCSEKIHHKNISNVKLLKLIA